jgi:HPt (histidine-containing phosphotransfer) domain-containing protein/CheY-like chemotaxis protein
VPDEIVSRLFKPFSPGDSSYAKRDQGAGLGLAVAKRIVDSVSGDIGFQSEPGQGSTFWFSMPAVGPAERSEPMTSEHDAVPPPSGLHLLVFVTDDVAPIELARALEPYGNKLVFAANAAEAVALAGREDFDAIIMAARDADTLAAAPSVKAPILVLLAPGDRAPVCAAELLHGPVDTQQLYRALANICATREAASPAPSSPETMAAIDGTAFAALERSVGATTLVEILKSYIETTEHLCAALATANDDANWPQAARLAQDIAGSASGLGLLAMTAAARGFAAAARQGASAHALRNDAQKIVCEHERVRRVLANLYPELAA